MKQRPTDGPRGPGGVTLHVSRRTLITTAVIIGTLVVAGGGYAAGHFTSTNNRTSAHHVDHTAATTTTPTTTTPTTTTTASTPRVLAKATTPTSSATPSVTAATTTLTKAVPATTPAPTELPGVAICDGAQPSQAPIIRPSFIAQGCVGANYGINGIRWTSWTQHTAQGIGTFYADTCDPNCATGHLDTYPNSLVELSIPVDDNGWLFFSDLYIQTNPPSPHTGLERGGEGTSWGAVEN